MIAPACQHARRKKHGKDRKGQQRWRCPDCRKTFTSDQRRPLGDMRIDLDKACTVLGLLLEGMSIRACSRVCKIKPDTICDLVLLVGQNCQRFLREKVKGVAAKRIELDEIWGFIYAKSRTVERNNLSLAYGDSWTWLAIDADSKLILSHAVGHRNEHTCRRFLEQLRDSTTGPCQVTSDGLRLYTLGVPLYLGTRCSFAQLIKTYSASQVETRYSPATITGIEKTIRFGSPDEDKISTSYSERLNLSVRMHVRRFTRLTNAHSKSVDHHAAMMAIFCAWYNHCRCNQSLGKKVSPAMAAGLTEKPWTIRELLEAAA